MSANSIRRRQKKTFEISDVNSAFAQAAQLFQAEGRNECFDLIEQLIKQYPQAAIAVLAKVYDWYKSIDNGDRYSLYQSRVFDFGIEPGANVLDVGSGHLPFPLATVLTDSAVEDNFYGRAGAPIKTIHGLPVHSCSIESLPFGDKEFDFVNCSHVIEHVKRPDVACNELIRVAKRGYIETPTPAKDQWLNMALVSNHNWMVSVENEILIFREYTESEKEGLGHSILLDMHANPRTEREKAFSTLVLLKSELVNTMFMWEDDFRYIVYYADGQVVENQQKGDKPVSLSTQRSAKPSGHAQDSAPALITAHHGNRVIHHSDPLPKFFTIETVLGCNLKCPECAIGGGFIDRRKGVMRLPQFRLLFDKVKPHCQYLFPHLWGEPTLNPDLARMIAYAIQHTRVNISTNAVRLQPKQIDELIVAGPTDLIVSVDGVSQGVYEQYRRKGDVEKAKANIRLLQEANMRHGGRVKIIPQFIVFEHNKHEMRPFKDYCNALGLEVHFKAPYTRKGDRVQPTEIAQYRRPEFETLGELQVAMAECSAPRNDMVVLLDGSVVVCCHDYNGVTTMGNLFDQTVEEIWHSEKYRQFRHQVMSGKAPQYCQDYCMEYRLRKPRDNEVSVPIRIEAVKPWPKQPQRIIKFLQINSFYGNALKSLYQRVPGLEIKPFADQSRAVIEDGFNAIHMYAPYLESFGYQSTVVVINNEAAQRQWLKEHPEVKIDGPIGLMEFVKRQIEFLKPDVLYLDDPVAFSGDFLARLEYRPPVVMGWRAANIPVGTNWNGMDVILSNLDAVRDVALRLGAKRAENFHPGFPSWIHDKVRDIEPQFDVVFCGQINNTVHRERTRLLDGVASAALKTNRFSCAFFLSGDPSALTPALKSVSKGSRYGIEMHRALKSGRICIDARGDIGLVSSSGQQTENLAGKQTSNMRIFEAAGSGLMVLTEFAENLGNYFKLGVEIETFRYEQELIEKLIYYSEHPAERDDIAARGYSRIQKEHAMDIRCKALDAIIRDELGISIEVRD